MSVVDDLTVGQGAVLRVGDIVPVADARLKGETDLGDSVNVFQGCDLVRNLNHLVVDIAIENVGIV